MFVNVILINKENEEFKRALIVVDGMALTVDDIRRNFCRAIQEIFSNFEPPAFDILEIGNFNRNSE